MNICPKTYMAESILVTLFCCLPFGVVGIINASKVSSLYAAGNVELAQAASLDAKNGPKSDSSAVLYSMFFTLSCTA